MKKIVPSITQICLTSLKKYTNNQKALVLTTPRSELIAKKLLKGLNIQNIIYLNSSKKSDVVAIANRYKKDGEIVYAVGGGRVMDVGRYLANYWGLKIICVPTIISSDAFLVDCTGLRENGCVKYVSSKKADEILIDFDLIQQSPLRYNLSGCGDILSIYTGSYDWFLANKNKKAKTDEVYSPSVARIAESILEAIFKGKNEIKRGTKSGLETILRLMILEVTLCNTYGNSRPEEGGEHFFAYCIENKVPHFLHGEVVSLGVLITAFLQKRDWNKIKDFMDGVNLSYRPDVVNKQVVLSTLQEMKNYVIKHKLRYSIYNEFDFESKRDAIVKFLKYLKIKD